MVEKELLVVVMLVVVDKILILDLFQDRVDLLIFQPG
tara:strand:- start:543 stop:653 length:111 start_codon:yes stop_codon:yes gene_type:complete